MVSVYRMETYIWVNPPMRDLPEPDLLLPLPQSPEYARALSALGLPVRAMRQSCGGAERLWWQVQSRRFGPLGRVDLISRGPVAADRADLAG